ncbi:hypothetical protein O0L34_g10494 [Tuta absoluta]|nr:hypothetical protein O0L34_g10494 [Tuta absoluta]
MRDTAIDENTMAEDKKNPIKSIIKNIKCKLGLKKDKEQLKEKAHVTKEKQIAQEHNDTHEKESQLKPKVNVNDLVDDFIKKLEIDKGKESKRKEEEDESNNFSFSPPVGSEHSEFTYIVVEDDRTRTESLQSTSSQDSGFSEKGDEKFEEVCKKDDDVIETKDEDAKTTEKKDGDPKVKEEVTEKKDDDQVEEEVLDALQKLNLEDGKKRKAQVVTVARGPVRNKVGDLSGAVHLPYPRLDTQINTTINKHTFSGGQVIVANVTQAFEPLTIGSQEYQVLCDPNTELLSFSEHLESRGVRRDGDFDLEDVQDLIDSEICQDLIARETSQSINKEISQELDLGEFLQDPSCNEHLNTIATLAERIADSIDEENPLEAFYNTTSNIVNYEKIEYLDEHLGLQEPNPYVNMYPTPPSAEIAHSPSNYEFYNLLTPPRSDTVPSPMSDRYQSSSECVLSPNSDCEKYQPLSFEDMPSIPEEFCHEDAGEKKRERHSSTSSMTMKNYKDMQKDLSKSFSEKECCQMNRKPCREVFQEHLKSLKAEERKNMCLKVASMDLKTIYGVLHHIILGLSGGAVDESLHLSLFALLCEKALGTKSQVFLEDFGLELLKAATFRCPQRPLLVRYLVQCVRTAVKHNPKAVEGKQFIFKEVDAQGDTLVTACARAGDAYAPVLAELVHRDNQQVALFNIQHVNTEGHSALHVACREHSAISPRLHTVHVLLEHGNADIWKGDVKGGDTAVHMSVNSAQCDLRLVLLLFKHLDRKQWKALAHAHNRSSVTPLDYARCAAKPSARDKYPAEVLEFLKKCR